MLNEKMRRLIATLVLVGFVGSAGLPIIAEASSHHSESKHEYRIYRHKEEQRMAEHRREEHRREENRRYYHRVANKRHHDHDSHSDIGNLVTGLIIGGVLGSVVANNNR